MQKPKHPHSLIIIGSEASFIDSLKRAFAETKLNHKLHAANDSSAVEHILKEQNIELAVYQKSTDVSFNTVAALVGASNRDIPIIIAYEHPDTEQQLSDSKNPHVTNFIQCEQPDLASAILLQELKNLENRRRRRQAEFFLQETEQRCRSLLDSSTKPTAFLNRDSKFIYANSSFVDMLNQADSSSLLGKSLSELIPPSHSEQLTELLSSVKDDKPIDADLPLVTDTQGPLAFNLTLQKTRFERTQCIEVNLSSASGQIAPAKPVEDDHLTGLKNQLYLHKQLQREININTETSQTSFLLYIKPEYRSKAESDSDFGLQDNLMRACANNLKPMVNRPHSLVRYQENAFCVLFSNADQDKAKILAEQIHQSLSDEPLSINGRTLKLNTSIGIAPIAADSFEPNMVLSLAMSAAAEAENGIGIHGIEEAAEDSVSSEELQNAVAKGQLKLLFQPVVSLCGEQKSYYEVLLRMLDENNNQISPNEFINMLSHDDISIELDRWVISSSIQQLVEAKEKSTLFINLTGRTIKDPQFTPWLAQQLSKTSISAEHLIFQFSEADIAEHKTQINTLISSLNKLQAQICIKHFGSTINSDIVFNQVDAKFIKLDGSFIQELGDRSKHETFDRLIEPIKKQRKTLIAPLVEDTSVISKLFMSGVGYIQGYYLQAPREQMDYDFFNE